ncbi:MAG: ABC transporter ATP-binding protein [Nitrospira sp.]|nr:ABC transporter ATP-binding protein [Nitrospira sp.]
MIKVVGLHKSFPIGEKELAVLKGIHLEIPRGEMLTIVGASGVGKSTFLHILGTLERPTTGQVLFDGMDLFKMSDAGLAEFRNRRIGFVFQFHHLLPEFTALENVAMPGMISGMGRRKAFNMAHKLLAEVGLESRLHHKPSEMSGGEQQRVAVVRALLMEPPLVLADEPTGNLDSATGEEVFRLLKDLNQRKGITFVIVTHNEKLAAQSHRIVSMVDGRIE